MNGSDAVKKRLVVASQLLPEVVAQRMEKWPLDNDSDAVAEDGPGRSHSYVTRMVMHSSSEWVGLPSNHRCEMAGMSLVEISWHILGGFSHGIGREMEGCQHCDSNTSSTRAW
jgi:hypothetical protein